MKHSLSRMIPFANLMDVEIGTAEKDRILGTLLVRPELCPTNNIVHGGALMVCADTLGAYGRGSQHARRCQGDNHHREQDHFSRCCPRG